VLIGLGQCRLAGRAGRPEEVEAVVDHAGVAQGLRRGVQAAVAGAGDGVDKVVRVRRHVVLQRRAVRHRAEHAHAVHAGNLRLQLADLLDLVVDLGDVVDHLLDGLHQVGGIDDRDTLGRAGGGRDGEQRCSGKAFVE
jgi:hypothetical protein